ncbi:MAG: DUF4426 domain-containing protein [Gammaproteobacteria bacterium]|nr:DUF4426 domain-containing protein [Gammaproteobacteria bacterium]MCY4276777.1 DUF4426 domain-containing protein [Gammaproteobacteria bacterium]MCY4322073.1 DUF4426 domain-containing protein [Gammaproteobacteria bacterium]
MLCALFTSEARCEQFIEVGGYQAHYMILDTLSLDRQVAQAYGIVRAYDESILTISILDADGASVVAKITGSATNLLGMVQTLSFNAIREGEAHYAIAAVKHTEEQMRFALHVQMPNGRSHEVKFEQKLYPGIK